MFIITGTVAYDYIMDFPGAFAEHILPEQLHQINLSFIVSKFAKRRGGTAGNVSYSLGLLETPHDLLSYAGQDFAEYKDAFEKLGINTSNVKIDKKDYTATGFAMTDKSDNQIWGYFYGAAKNIPLLKLGTLSPKKDMVIIGPSGAAGSLSFVKQCISKRIPYMFDPGFILTEVTDADLNIGLQHATYVIGNDYEITLMEKRIPTWRAKNNKQTVIKTLGKEGTIIYSAEREVVIKPVPVKTVSDPSGAGDAFRSGFLAGLQRGFDLQTCGQMGAVAAAYAVEQYGTQEHIYTLEQFKKRYSKTYNQPLELA